MSIDDLEKGNSKKKLLKILIGALILIALIVYFRIFLIKGIVYEDTFLKKSVISSTEFNYAGISGYGDISITVKDNKENGSIEVIYSLPNNIYEEYTVEFSNSTTLYGDKDVIIKKDALAVYDGVYTPKSSYLINHNGDAYFDNYTSPQIIHNGNGPFNSDYEIPLKNVADLAYFANDTILGKFELLIFAVFLFAITLFDWRFPLFFFTLKHLLDVRNPEPSDIYLYIQKLTWILYPVIGVCLMIFAIIANWV